MPRRPYVTWFVVALASAVAAVYSAGRAYDDTLVPGHHRAAFTAVDRSGWTSPSGSVSLTGLLGSGNRAVFGFEAWRPPGAGAALVTVRRCGDEVARLAVTDDTPVQLAVRGGCEPVRFDVVVDNPFPDPNGDGRPLGVTLKSVKVTSALGVPLVAGPVLAGLWCAFAVLGAGAAAAARSRGALAPVAASIPLLAVPIAWGAGPADVPNLLALLFTACVTAAGAAAASLHRHGGEGRPAEEGGAPPSRLPLILALTAVVLGGCLRFYGLGFGLPGKYHPDETPKINAIMRMVGSGTLNPKYFLHPSLLLYLTYFTNSVFHWIGAEQWFGIGTGFADTARLAGRTVSAAAGTGSVFLLYLLGRRLYGPFVGVLSALLLAVFPLHVTCSRYMKEDALLLFLLLACVLAALKAAAEGKPRFLFLAALLAGFSAGAKYSGALSVAFVLAAPWYASGTRRPDRRLALPALASLVMVPIGFLITTPYSVLDFEAFSIGFNNERKHMLKGHTVSITAWSQYWMYHLRRSVLPGVTVPVATVGLLGAGLLAWRRRREDLLVLSLLLLFYGPAEWVRAKPAPQPERYILPCLPFLAVACAEFVRVAANSRYRAAIPAAAAVLFAFPAVRSTLLASEIRDDTRERMAEWMKENLPRGSKVLVDWTPYAPQFPGGEFEVVMFPPGKMFKMLHPDELKTSGADYLVLSSLVYSRFFDQPEADRFRRAVLRNAFSGVPLVKTIEPRHGTYGFHNPTIRLFSLAPSAFAAFEKKKAEARADEESVRASLGSEARDSSEAAPTTDGPRLDD